MTLPAAVADKIALILPRLGSDHDGEIVASVKAIERTLKGAGADWHDLSSTFTRGAAAVVVVEKEPPPRQAAQPRRHWTSESLKWDSLSFADRIAWLTICAKQTHLSPWEQSFVESILASLQDDPYRPLSPKQRGVCARIIRDAFNCGYRA